MLRAEAYDSRRFAILTPLTPARLAAESLAIAVILGLRLVAIRWRLRLPEFRMRKKL